MRRYASGFWNTRTRSILLRLILMRLSGDARCQTFDAVLELAVLGGVDERIDTAVGEHQYHSEVIEHDDNIADVVEI